MLESWSFLGLISVLIHANVGYARCHRESMPVPGSETSSSLNLRANGFPPVMPEQNQQLPLNFHRLVTSVDNGKIKILNVLKNDLKDKVVFEVVLNQDKRLNGKKFSIKKKFLEEHDNVSVYTGKHRISPEGIEAFLKKKGVDKKIITFAKQNAINLLWSFKNSREVHYDYSQPLVKVALTNISKEDIVFFNSRATMAGIQFWANQESKKKNEGKPSWMKKTGMNVGYIPTKQVVRQTVIDDFRIDECECCGMDKKGSFKWNRDFICDECNEDSTMAYCQPCGRFKLECKSMWISDSAAEKYEMSANKLHKICEDCICEVE